MYWAIKIAVIIYLMVSVGITVTRYSRGKEKINIWKEMALLLGILLFILFAWMIYSIWLYGFNMILFG